MSRFLMKRMKMSKRDISVNVQAGLSVDTRTYELCMGLIAAYAKSEGLKGLNLRFTDFGGYFVKPIFKEETKE